MELDGLFLWSDPVHFLGDGYVLQHGEVREKVEELKDHADFGTNFVEFFFAFAEFLSVYPDFAAGRGFEVVDAAQHGRFSRAVWSE